MPDLATQIRVYRAKRKLTQKKLARTLKISQTALSLLETGKPVPQLSHDQLKQIAKVTEAA